MKGETPRLKFIGKKHLMVSVIGARVARGGLALGRGAALTVITEYTAPYKDGIFDHTI